MLLSKPQGGLKVSTQALSAELAGASPCGPLDVSPVGPPGRSLPDQCMPLQRNMANAGGVNSLFGLW